MELYEFSDYRKIVEALIESSKGSILRSDLARSAGCSPSWITRALNGSVQLTPDQMLGIAELFQLNELEIEYILGLLEWERASTITLKKRIHLKLQGIKREAKALKLPVTSDSNLSESELFKYYSSWVYAAIHVATMIQKFTAVELAEKLKLDLAAVLKVLNELEKMKLVVAKVGRWEATSNKIHLSATNPIAKQGHINWRNRTISYLQNPTSVGLHYSAPHCLSKKDISIISEKLKQALMECRQVIEPSPSETLAVLSIDWYELFEE